MRRLGRDVAALLLGAALAMGGVPTSAVAEAIGHATACEEGVVTDPEDVRAEGVEAVGNSPEAETGSEAADPSETESEGTAAPSLPDALPDLLPEVPSGDPASEALGAVEYVDENGSAQTCYDYTDISAVRSEKANSLWDGWYVVRSDRTFPDYTLDIHGDVNIILCDGATLRCAHGIRNAKKLGSSLHIWGQREGTGRLVADAGAVEDAAGIGGFEEDEDGGTLVVHGGTVRAWGGRHAAGIGGGEKGDGGEIIVRGGYVLGWGGRDAAGIGGGFEGDAGQISVLGGSVYAYGDNNAAGLGGGEYGDGGRITISGGYVHAEADHSENDVFSPDYFTGAGAGIGGGEDRDGGVITITGGIVEAYGGRGCVADFPGDSGAGAGIGGGDEGAGGVITISGGEVRATGGENMFGGAGLGGGRNGVVGNITISGGEVRATGLYGIGGYFGNFKFPPWLPSGSKITITGGHVIAHGNQAIGHGDGDEDYGDGVVSVDYSRVRVLSGSLSGKDVELREYHEGTCGGCSWRLEDGALTVEPTNGVSGTLDDAYACGGLAFPWLEHAGEIRSVTFRDGVALPEQAVSLFHDCSNLTSVDAARCDASGATHMGFMFSGCSSLASLDLSGWNVSGVYVVSYMFENCSSLASLDLSGWRPRGVSEANSAFFGCSSLASLDLSGWDVSGAEDLRHMFDGCSSLSEIFVGEGFDASRAFPEATSDTGMWWSVADGAWYTADEIASERAHVADTYLAHLPTCGGCAWILAPDGALAIAPADGVSGTLADADRSGDIAFPWLARKDEITSVAFAPGVSLPMDSSSMFEGCGRLESVEASHVDASKVESTRGMFSGCSSLSSLDLSAWGVSGAAYDVSHMFEGCASLASLDLSGWKARGVFNAVGAFSGCSSLTSLDLSGWELSRFMLPSNMGRMFDGCASLSEITVGEGFDVSRAFPEATSDTGMWWSVADGAWHTVDEIASERAHVADTYLSFEQGV